MHSSISLNDDIPVEIITDFFDLAKYVCSSKSTISADAVLNCLQPIFDKNLADSKSYGVDKKLIFLSTPYDIFLRLYVFLHSILVILSYQNVIL